MLNRCCLLDALRGLLYDGSMIRFQDRSEFTDDDITEALERNDLDELKLVSISVALLSPDPIRAQAVCLRLCRHPDGRVRAHALISLGHLARRFRSLEEAVIKPMIETALGDKDEYVRVHAKSAADEIHQFLHWEFTGHVYG